MQIYLHFVEHVCMELWFVWECSNIDVRYVKHGVSFINQYTNYCPYDYSVVEDIFYGELFVFQEFSDFFHSVLVLPYYCLDIALKVLRSKYGKTIRLSIYRTSKFFEGIFQTCCQKFYSNSFSEHRFVVSTMTAWGFLSGWNRLATEWECYHRPCNKFNILIFKQIASPSFCEEKLQSIKGKRNQSSLKF